MLSTFFLLSMFVIININLHLYKNISKNNIIKVVMVNRYRLFISLSLPPTTFPYLRYTFDSSN